MPVVTSLHDLYPYDSPANFGFPRVLGHRLVLRQCLRNSDRVACVSDFTLGRLAALFGADLAIKSSRIHNCVEAQPVREHRPAIPLSGRPFLLCIAQHRRNKNFDLLLKGFAAMRAQGVVSKETLLLVLGSAGPETPAIMRSIERLALKDHVIVREGITDAELAWLYKNAVLALCTSTIEGFGLPLVEANQHGARVVCSDIPAFREIGGDNCTFFSLSGSNPVEDFVRACEHALRKSPQPQAHQSLFNADTIAAQYITLYSDLMRSGVAQAA